MFLITPVQSVYHRLTALLEWLAPVGDLLLRLWVARVFFMSGLTKTDNFDATIGLFTYIYHVPLLPPAVAAYLGTATELSMPVLLALGLAGRPAAIILFVFNIIAVISFPGLSPDGVELHMMWGLMLLVIVLRGPGKLSLDTLLERYLPALHRA
ncbi:MAG: DoxX family protein [Gammaproteobacteria bacterium]|jgi:putative oxidoreductase